MFFFFFEIDFWGAICCGYKAPRDRGGGASAKKKMGDIPTVDGSRLFSLLVSPRSSRYCDRRPMGTVVSRVSLRYSELFLTQQLALKK